MTLSSDSVLKELKNLGVKFSKSKLKSSYLKQRVLSSNPVKRVFGVSLCEQEWIEVGNEFLPKFLAEITSFLQMYVNQVGIFRIAGSISRQKILKQKLNNGGQLEEADPCDVGGILKQWLRELQDSLIPVPFHDIFYKCLQLEEPHKVSGCLLTCLLLPPDHLLTLRHLMQFLAFIAANSDKNQMDAYNLAVVIAPNIFVVQTNKKNLNDHQLHTSVIEILIKNADRIGATSMFPQQSISQNFKGSELDSSTEFLDSSPKSKGTVQEFLNGIKKLVGQGTSATPSKLLMPDVPRKCPSSTSFKRKAEVCSVTPAKKSKEEKRVNISPLSKESRTDNTLKTGFTRHSRRKTFDILRRRNKNKSKNSKTTDPIAVSSNSDAVPAIMVTDEFNQTNLPKKVSSLTKFRDVPASKDAFQKSESDSHLAPYSRKIASASSSSLQDNKRVEQSPYCLRPHKTPYISQDRSSVASLAETTSMLYNCTAKTKSRHRQPIPQIETIVCPMPELPKSNRSIRKQGTISRQQAFIIKNVTKKPETITHQTRKRDNAYATLHRSKQKIQNRQPTPLKKNKSISVLHTIKEPSASQKAKAPFTTLDFQPKNIEVDCPELKNVDFNLSFNFENLFLSPPKGFNDNPESTITPDNATATCKPSSTTATPDSRTLRSAKKSLSTPNQDVRSLSKSKMPRLRVSFNSSSSIDSISELKQNARTRRSDSMISPVIMPNSNLEESCFKTPNQTNTSINWMSASKYLDAEPPRDPGVTNKRESIAMILRNRGHVQDKIGLFDRHSVYIPSNCSTPTGKKTVRVTRSCNSATGRMNRSKVQKRLPPPPKFVMPETPSKPLKEVTNVCKSIIPKNPLTKKPARSTSVHLPRATRKKVSRSHSSPASKSRISRKAVNHRSG